MNYNLLIETKEIGNHRISIYYDNDQICPCIDWDMAACFLWEYNKIERLSDECNWKEVFGEYGDNRHSLTDALHQLINDHVAWKDLLDYFKTGKVDNYRMRYDRHEKIWYLEGYNESKYSTHNGYQEIFSVSPSDLYTYDYTDEFVEGLKYNEMIQILHDLGKDIFVKEWSTRGYSQGDYVRGIAFCTEERYKEMVNTDTTDWKNKINELIDGEVKCIGMWMWGDVKKYILEEKIPYTKHYHDSERKDQEEFEWEEIAYCGGFFMETDELIQEVISQYDLNKTA